MKIFPYPTPQIRVKMLFETRSFFLRNAYLLKTNIFQDSKIIYQIFSLVLLIKPLLIKKKRVVHSVRNTLEDEMHFLVVCNNFFNVHRETLFSHASNVLVGFQLLSHKQKPIKLASDPLTVKATAKYLRKTFELREFLLKPHKGPG